MLHLKVYGFQKLEVQTWLKPFPQSYELLGCSFILETNICPYLDFKQW